MTAYAPGLKEPNLNFALQTGELQGNFEDILQKVDTFYKPWEIGWYWLLNPSRDQKNIKKSLHKCGYSVAETYSTFIGFLDYISSEEFLKNYTIKEVEEEELLEWTRPLQEAFQGTEESTNLYKNAHVRALHKQANFRHFVAYVGREPVSAATLSLSSYGARLDDLGTKPAFQRQGFGKALVLYQMEIAKDLGYEWVCLDASDQGGLLYKALGFQELCQNQFYKKVR
ncbi:MAG: GNAT family N-acetyltransferase [Alphaproteobacteria bacterium]|nr:GNAT family N-acetyltransferase [Alphaproteobacteria bacterium]